MLFTQALISSRAISDWFAAEAGSIASKLNGGLLGIREPGGGGYRLHRARPAEHIDALNFFGGVAAFGEQLGVAGERRGTQDT